MTPKRPRGAGAYPKPVESPVPDDLDPSDLYAALDLGTNSCRNTLNITITHISIFKSCGDRSKGALIIEKVTK